MTANVRNLLGHILGRTPPMIQVAALCLHPDTGCVLMITSRGTGRWIIPKGWPMAGRSLAAAALQEAWEEAGVRADSDAPEIGRYMYDKVQNRGFATLVEVRVFKATVTELTDDWPERAERRREWFAPDEAATLVAEPQLASLLRSLRTAG